MKLLLILITIFISFIKLNESMIYDKDLTITGKYILVEQFGFDDDGTIQILVEDIEFQGPEPTNPPPTIPSDAIVSNNNNNYHQKELRGEMARDPISEELQESSDPNKVTPITYFNMTVWACKDREYQSLIGSSPNNFIENKLCNDANAGNCPMQNITISAGKSINFTLSDSDMYRIIILKCVDDRQAKVKLHYTLRNPSGHLSKGYLPLPKLYKYMIAVISVIFVGTLYYWARYKKVLNQIHYLLFFIVVLKFILLALTLFYWESADNTGRFNIVLNYFQNLFFSFTETAFFGALFILSRGLKITRTRLTAPEARTISLILLFLLSVLLFFSFYNDVYYFLSLMILYFFMMPKIFTNITKNIRVLESHLILSRYMNSTSQENYSLKKKVFRYLRTAIVLYLGAILFVNSVRIVMVWWLYWVSYCVSEPMSLLMLTFLLYLFKPTVQRPNIFEDSDLNQHAIHDISRTLEHLMNENLDPISLASLLESRTFDPNSCIIIQYPSNTSSLALGITESSKQVKT